MKKIIFLLAAAIAATGCTTSKVLKDNSVAQQFAVFNKSGWSVTGGGINDSRRLVPIRGGQGFYHRQPASSISFNPFSHAIWNTNFKVDAKNGATVVSTPDNSNNPMIISQRPNAGVNADQPALAGHPGSVQLRN